MGLMDTPVIKTDTEEVPRGMRMSADGLRWLAGLEGSVRVNGLLLPYKDLGGIETAGFGHVIKPGEDFSKPLTEKDAWALLRTDVQAREDIANRLVSIPLAQNEFDSVVSTIYNIGEAAFEGSKARAALNRGDFDEYTREIGEFKTVTQDRGLSTEKLVESSSLVKRREAEADKFGSRRFPKMQDNIDEILFNLIEPSE